MKVIRLQALKIENFKGITRLALELGGVSASIYGDNATGKTTVYDALTWLLFDKDSHGAARFEIKPLGADGRVREAGVMPTVEAALTVDGVAVTLRKSLREKWERVRGSVDKRLSGNTTDYFVDDVPRKEGEFKRIIAEIIDEGVFRELTNVHYFCGGLRWQDRRARLFALCNVASDEALLAGAPGQFAELREAVGRHSVDEYRAMIAAQRKSAKATLDAAPVRIDECMKTIEAAAGLDFAALRARETALTEERTGLAGELVRLENNALLAEKRAALDGVKNELRELDLDNQQYRREQAVPAEDKRPALRRDIERLQAALTNTDARIARITRELEAAAAGLRKCHDDWDAVAARVFSSTEVCQLCGQALPPDQIEEARAAFEAQKDADKLAVEEYADSLREQKRQGEQRLTDLREERADYQESHDAAERELAALGAQAAPVVTDMPDYAERFAALVKRLSALEGEVAALGGETAGIRKSTTEKITALDAELREVRGKLALEATVKAARARIEEIHEERRKAAAFQENCDRLIELCEDFVRYKVQSITEAVNGRFSLVRFRLFTEQVNGGLAECCDATVDGVPYDSLNSAAKVNAGLDCIAALSAHAGVQVPLFVDNAEGVTRLYPLGTQVIRLVVSEADKELRCVV